LDHDTLGSEITNRKNTAKITWRSRDFRIVTDQKSKKNGFNFTVGQVMPDAIFKRKSHMINCQLSNKINPMKLTETTPYLEKRRFV